MESNRVHVLLADSLVESVEEQLTSKNLRVSNQPTLTADQLPAVLQDVDILVVRSTKVTAEAIASANRLGLIVRAGAGVNTIDVSAASALGIQVANCPGKNAAAVAELSMGLLIAADRRIVDGCSDLRAGHWKKKEYGKADGLKTRKLGLLGFGAIAKAVAKAAQGLDMDVIAWSRSLTDEVANQYGVTRVSSPQELAASSDAVSIHLALTPETKHFVDANFLSALRDSAILINTSRGGVVDTAALKHAIETKHLRVALDVFEEEPSGGEAPFEDTEFARQITATPHIGASTRQTSESIGAEVVRIIDRFVATGCADNAVNLRAKSEAPHRLVVRHLNQVGVLASVLDALREEQINVEEMDNTIFSGGESAVCCLQLDRPPSPELIDALASNEPILQVLVGSDR